MMRMAREGSMQPVEEKMSVEVELELELDVVQLPVVGIQPS
jgi:hypothetical protein